MGQVCHVLAIGLSADHANVNGDDHPVDPKPARNVVQMPTPPKMESRTDRGTSVVDLFGVLRTLGFGEQAEFYRDVLGQEIREWIEGFDTR